MPASWRCPGYDAQNRLISATVAVTRETIAYDSRNRVVERTVGGTSTSYVYDGWNLIEEYNAGGTLQASYVHGVQADELVGKTSGSTTVYYHQNANGNVACLTGAGGTVVENYKYDAFGAATITDGSGHALTLSAYGNRFMFTGREYLAELGIYDYRNRDYSPSLGRFLQTDPIRNQILEWLATDPLSGAEFSQGTNLYCYCLNDPIDLIDPFGLNGYTQSGPLSIDDDSAGSTPSTDPHHQNQLPPNSPGDSGPGVVAPPEAKGVKMGDPATLNTNGTSVPCHVYDFSGKGHTNKPEANAAAAKAAGLKVKTVTSGPDKGSPYPSSGPGDAAVPATIDFPTATNK